MKMRVEETTIERSSNIIESTFGISEKDSAHILTILRDKLYSDKILAVVREYCTNARDAHVEAGKLELPIKVSLPGPIDPSFRVRDFGPGLSEEDVRTIYVMYGASTKRNTNQQVGMLGLGCLLKGEPIVTIEGMKPVEEIKVGDLVLTHTGNWRKVTNIMNRHHVGKTYKIHMAQGTNPVVLTWEHPILIANSQGETEWKLPGDILAGYRSMKKGIRSWNSYLVLPKNLPENLDKIDLKKYLGKEFQFINGDLHHETEWKQTNHLTKTPYNNHKNFIWKNFPEYLPADYETGWLLGLWCAEGCAGKKQLNLTLNINEDSLASRFIDGMKKLFGIEFKVYKRLEHHSQELIVSNTPTAKILRDMCGYLSKNKHIPIEVMQSNKEMRSGFLAGLMDGDGSSIRDKFIFGTASKNLAWGARTLMMEQGLWNTVGYMESPGTKKDSNPRWSILFNKKPAWVSHFETKDYLCRPICKIEEFELETEVFNFSVEEDESYVGQFIFHNCKSFFAYVDRFHITSWFGGEKKVYCAYIDETKCGKIALLSSEKSDEPDGIEVSGPVQQKDFKRFAEVAQNILRFFSPLPEVSGTIIKLPNYMLTGSPMDGFKYSIHSDTGDDFQIIMGGIPYPIAVGNFKVSSYGRTAEEDLINAFVNLDVDIVVPIGYVDVAANRESLEYTTTTLTNLKKLILVCAKHAKEMVSALISNATTLREANILLHNLKQQRDFWGISTSHYKLNGIPVTGMAVPGYKYCDIYKPSSYITRKNRKWRDISGIEAEKDILIFEADTTDWKKRMTAYADYNNLPYNKIYVLDWRPETDGINPKIGISSRAEAFKEYQLEDYDIKKVSDCIVPKQITVRGVTTSGPKSINHLGNIFLLKDPKNRPIGGIRSLKWTRVASVPTGIKYYVLIDIFVPVRDTTKETLESLDNYISLAKGLGLDINYTNFFGVKISYKEKIQVDPSWKNLYDEIKTLVASANLDKLILESRGYDLIPYNIQKCIPKASLFPQDSEARKLLSFASKLRESSEKIQKIGLCYDLILQRLRVLGLNISCNYDITQLDLLRKRTAERYPLLREVGLFELPEDRYYSRGNSLSDDIFPHVVEYIQWIEKKQEEKIND